MNAEQCLELARTAVRISAEQLVRQMEIVAARRNRAAEDRLSIIESNFWRRQQRLRSIEAAMGKSPMRQGLAD